MCFIRGLAGYSPCRLLVCAVVQSRCPDALLSQLDLLLSPPGESARDLKAARERAKAAAKKRKARRKAEAKAADKVGSKEGQSTAAGNEKGEEDSWEDDDVEAAPEVRPKAG